MAAVLLHSVRNSNKPLKLLGTPSKSLTVTWRKAEIGVSAVCCGKGGSQVPRSWSSGHQNSSYRRLSTPQLIQARPLSLSQIWFLEPLMAAKVAHTLPGHGITQTLPPTDSGCSPTLASLRKSFTAEKSKQFTTFNSSHSWQRHHQFKRHLDSDFAQKLQQMPACAVRGAQLSLQKCDWVW